MSSSLYGLDQTKQKQDKSKSKPKGKAKRTKSKKGTEMKKDKDTTTSDPIFNVEELRARRTRNGVEYLVKWEGFGEDKNTWEPASNIIGPDLIPELEERERKGGWQWQYYVASPIDGKGVGWHTFEDDRSVSISNAYAMWCADGKVADQVHFQRTIPKKSAAGGVSTYDYSLDFAAMTQQNKSVAPHTIRAIRRVYPQ